jgi:hypothetical protein
MPVELAEMTVGYCRLNIWFFMDLLVHCEFKDFASTCSSGLFSLFRQCETLNRIEWTNKDRKATDLSASALQLEILSISVVSILSRW